MGTESPRSYLVAMFLGWAVATVLALAAIGFLGRSVPPKLSESLSFNMKARWLRDVDRCDVLILGSSMALNNIDGPELERLFPSWKVVNAGSWGLRISESRMIYADMARKCTPKVVVIPLFYGDFSHAVGQPVSSKSVDWAWVDGYLQGGGDGLAALPKTDLRYLWASFRNLRSPEFSSPRYYSSLKFDTTGGVLFSDQDFHVDPGRWSGYQSLVTEQVDNGEYLEFAALLGAARASGARTVVVNMPMIAAAEAKFDLPRVHRHWDRVASLVRAEHGIFIDFAQLGLGDGQFADFCHLKREGAGLVTRKIISDSGVFGASAMPPSVTQGNAAR